jgi:uncharacterized membrane protein YfhO
MTTSSQSESQVEIQITHFPGWRVWVDGTEAKIEDNNKYKLITVTVPKGQHEVRGKFTSPPVRLAGNALTLICLIGLITLILWYETRRNPR